MHTALFDIISEKLLDGRRERAMRGRFEMIAIDAAGRLTPITDAPPQTRDDAS